VKHFYLPFAWLFIGLFFVFGCASATPTPIEQFEAQDPACVVANAPVRADIDACRARAKARYEATLDAGADAEGGK
jgi:hypothetical protein